MLLAFDLMMDKFCLQSDIFMTQMLLSVDLIQSHLNNFNLNCESQLEYDENTFTLKWTNDLQLKCTNKSQLKSVAIILVDFLMVLIRTQTNCSDLNEIQCSYCLTAFNWLNKVTLLLKSECFSWLIPSTYKHKHLIIIFY